MAREKKVAAFVVMHDSTMEELCRKRPSTVAELMRVRGIGEHKAEVYGESILQALREFAGGARAAVRLAADVKPAEETLRLLREGRSFEEIARIRDREISTVVQTVAHLIGGGRMPLDPRWISPDAQPLIERLPGPRRREIAGDQGCCAGLCQLSRYTVGDRSSENYERASRLKLC